MSRQPVAPVSGNGIDALGNYFPEHDLDHPDRVAHVAQAQGSGPVGHSPATLRRIDVASMLTSDPEPVDWIAEGIVARGTLTLLAGREKEGKSLLAMAIAARAATGGGYLAGIDVTAARTLIVDAENGQRELHRRLRSSGLAREHADRIEVYETHAHDLRRHLHELQDVLESHKPDLVVLDSWRSLWGGDENDAGEVARVLDPLRNLIRGHNAAALLVHHMRKGGGYRGSSAIGASVENVIEMARMEDDPERRRRRLRNTACRYEQEADERWLSIEADRERGLILIAETDPYVPSEGRPRDSLRDEVLGALTDDPQSERALAKLTGIPRTTLQRILADADSDGAAAHSHSGWVAHPVGHVGHNVREGVAQVAQPLGAGPVGHQNGHDPDAELERLQAKFPDLTETAARCRCESPVVGVDDDGDAVCTKCGRAVS